MRQKIRPLWLLLIASVVLAVMMVGSPVFMIYPFREQTPLMIRAAYTLRSVSPVLTLIFLSLVLFVLIKQWRNSSFWKKSFGIFALFLVLAAAWFSRQNHFEWMFQPLANPSYVRAVHANFIRPDDMVLAVEHGKEAVAYPVRLLAYHHLVQDVVGGLPVVATY